jgi:hypothetical protein
MQVKNILNPMDHKVIDPTTGKIGFFKGFFSSGVLMGTHRTGLGRVYPINVSKEEFQEWHLASDKDKVNIQDLFQRK